MRKIQTQLYKDAFDKVKRMERVLRAVTEDGVPLTTACARENLQYKWFQRFVSQDIDADRDDQKTAVTVTWDDWSTWQERLLRDIMGEITPIPEGFDEIYHKIAAENLPKEAPEAIRLRYEEMLTLEEIAAQMSIPKNKVSRILATALHILRHQKSQYSRSCCFCAQDPLSKAYGLYSHFQGKLNLFLVKSAFRSDKHCDLLS